MPDTDTQVVPVSPFSAVPSEVPDDYFLDALVPRLETEHDVLRYQVADQIMKQLDERRRAENKRLLELGKAWEVRKEKFRTDLLRLMGRSADGKISTMVGTTYRRGETEMTVEVTNEELAALYAMAALDMPDAQPDPVLHPKTNEPLIKWTPHVTAAGRAFLAGCAQTEMNNIPETEEMPAYEDIIPGCVVKPSRPIVVTRARSKALTPEQMALVEVDEILPGYYNRSLPEASDG